MRYRSTILPAGMIIEISDNLVFNDHDKFREVIDLILQNNNDHYTLDLSDVNFIDSAGLGMLLIIQDEASKAGKSVSLTGVQGQVEKMIKIAHFEGLFHIH